MLTSVIFVSLFSLALCVGTQTLIAAVGADNPKRLKELLDEGGNIDAVHGESGQTLLMFGVLNGKTEAVKFLLENKADTTIAEKDGYTPVHGAGFQGRAEIMKLLAKHGMDVRHRHKDGYEPFQRACWGAEPRHTEVVKLLVEEYGVPADLKDGNGRTCADVTKSKATKKYIKSKKRKTEL